MPTARTPRRAAPGAAAPAPAQPSARRASPHARGRAGEAAGVRWLESHGYLVLERNAVTLVGEIDVVARDPQGVLCFIEVKARATATYGPAIAAVGPRKQRRLCRAAALYLATHRLHLAPCRFDVLGLDRAGTSWTFTLVRDAFPYRS